LCSIFPPRSPMARVSGTRPSRGCPARALRLGDRQRSGAPVRGIG